MRHTKAEEFKRTIGGRIFVGAAFFMTRREAIAQAALIDLQWFMRNTNTGTKVRTVPATKKRPERYLLFLPTPLSSYEESAVYNAMQYLFPE